MATSFLQHVCIFRTIHKYLWDSVFENKPDTRIAPNKWSAPSSSVRIWWTSHSSREYSRDTSRERWHWHPLYCVHLLALLVTLSCTAASHWLWHVLFMELCFKVRQNRKTRQLRYGEGKEASCSGIWLELGNLNTVDRSKANMINSVCCQKPPPTRMTSCAHSWPWV